MSVHPETALPACSPYLESINPLLFPQHNTQAELPNAAGNKYLTVCDALEISHAELTKTTYSQRVLHSFQLGRKCQGSSPHCHLCRASQSKDEKLTIPKSLKRNHSIIRRTESGNT